MPFDPQVGLAALAGVGGGLLLLWRGFGGYRMATRIVDTSVSRVASAAVGEVLVSGVVEAAELTLVSPLQSVPCVWYRATIDASDGESTHTDFEEERAVGFRVRDDSGDLRVFPRAARFDVPGAFDEKTGPFGDEPPGLSRRTGAAFAPPSGDREAQIAALLTVQPATPSGYGGDGGASPFSLSVGSGGSRSRRYREARLEPGQVVTVVGRALPFDQLADPAAADELVSGVGTDDPEVAASIAAARASGVLHDDPADAWGNAAIPGFGIGRPVQPPELDAGADAPPLAPLADAAAYARRFEIAPDALVIAASHEVPLVISLGTPAVAASRQQTAFLIGLAGAILAIACAMALAIMVSGEIP